MRLQLDPDWGAPLYMGLNQCGTHSDQLTQIPTKPAHCVLDFHSDPWLGYHGSCVGWKHSPITSRSHLSCLATVEVAKRLHGRQLNRDEAVTGCKPTPYGRTVRGKEGDRQRELQASEDGQGGDHHCLTSSLVAIQADELDGAFVRSPAAVVLSDVLSSRAVSERKAVTRQGDLGETV